MVEDSCFDELDRSCFKLSSQMDAVYSTVCEKVFYRLWAPLDPNKFDNATNKIKEVATRSLIVVGAFTTLLFTGLYITIPAVILAAGSKLFKAAGFYLQKNGFTHIRGDAEEKSFEGGQAKVMTWSICGYSGGLHFEQGGVLHWRSRIDGISEGIKKESPDIVVLETVYDPGLVEALFNRFKGEYAHFYAYPGQSGLMVMSKCAVDDVHYTPFQAKDLNQTKGYLTLEIKASKEDEVPTLRLVGTELSKGKGLKGRRREEFLQIIDQVARQNLAMTTLIVGSLHMDRDRADEAAFLSKYLYHSHRSKEKTETDELVGQWTQLDDVEEQSSDYISLCKRKLGDGRILPTIEKGVRLIDSHIVKGFDENYSTKACISDHHGVVTSISGLKRAAS